MKDLETKIKSLIKELEEDKEYYKWDIRYNLYEKIIKKLETLLGGKVPEGKEVKLC